MKLIHHRISIYVHGYTIYGFARSQTRLMYMYSVLARESSVNNHGESRAALTIVRMEHTFEPGK